MPRNVPLDISKIYLLPPAVDIYTLAPFIEAAALLVDEELSGSGLSEARLKLIEAYIAAHFAIQSFESGGYTHLKTGEGEEYYRTPDSKVTGLAASCFGQQALLLDNTGKLNAASAVTLKANFRVVSGTDSTTLLRDS